MERKKLFLGNASLAKYASAFEEMKSREKKLEEIKLVRLLENEILITRVLQIFLRYLPV